jgi:alcohol dehydrogenase
MKGYVYHGPGQSAWEDVPDPGIEEPTDIVVRVDSVTICGTDLHILKGDVPEVTPGTILGHEAVGEVVEVGGDVRTVRPGDRVLVSCITACGRCEYCKRTMYSHCRNGGGWILGHLINGTQAEFVRVPHADLSVHPLPSSLSSNDAVMLSDIFPTGYEMGVLYGNVQPGNTVAVVGAGPVGLAAMATAKLYGPERIIAIDLADARLEAAKGFGADAVVNAAEDPEQLVSDLTGGMGADVVIEAVGIPGTFEMCTRMVRPGGRVANVGVHGEPATLHLEELWIKNIMITMGLVDTSSTPILLGMAAAGRLPVSEMVTHTFELDAMEEAYDVFSRSADTGALKVVLVGEPQHDEVVVREAVAA